MVNWIKKHRKQLLIPLLSGLLVAGSVRAAEMYYNFDAGELVVKEAQRFIGALGITGNVTLSGDFTANTNQFFIDSSSGNVGIGDNSPSVRLSVRGSTSNTGNYIAAFYNSSGVLRSYINDRGAQAWFLQGGSGVEAGSISYTTPTGAPGIVFFDAAGNSRSDFRHVSGGGFAWAAGSGSAAPPEHMRLTASGNLGIGTATPSHKLTVNGRIAPTANLGGGLGDVGFYWGQSYINAIDMGGGPISGVRSVTANGTLGLGSGGTLDQVVISGGSVGVGTTNPTEKLTVAGTGRFTGALALDSSLSVAGATTFSSTLSIGGNATPTTDSAYDLGSPSLRWDNVYANNFVGTFTGTVDASLTAGSVVFGAADGSLGEDNANFFWDNASNRLGIGTSNPSDILHISGANNSGITISGVAGDSAPLVTIDNGDNAQDSIITARDNSAFSFEYPAGTSLLEIDTNGNVGIGTTSPTSKLHVVGVASASNPPLKIEATTGAANLRLMSLDASEGGGFYVEDNATSGFIPSFVAQSSGVNGYGGSFVGEIPSAQDSINGPTSAAVTLIGRTSAHGDLANANILNVRNNATSLLVVAANGNVGIGDTSPSSLLTVGSGGLFQVNSSGDLVLNHAGGYINFNSTSGSTGYGLRDNAGTIEVKNSGGVWTPLGGGSSLWTAAGSDIYHSGGNVGIGTTTPSAKLSIQRELNIPLTGTVAVTNFSSTVTGTGTAFTTELEPGDAVKIGSEVVEVAVIISDAEFRIYGFYEGATASGLTAYRGSSDPFFAINNAEGDNKFMIANGGNVDIFLSRATYPSASSSTGLRIGNAGSTANNVGIGLVAGTYGQSFINFGTTSNSSEARILYQGAIEDKYMAFNIQGSESMRIDVNGNVGIGTTSPTNKLSVVGAADVSTHLTVGSPAGSGEGIVQSVSNLAGDGYIETPIVYANGIQAPGERATTGAASIALGNIDLGVLGSLTDAGEIGLVTDGTVRLLVEEGGNIGIGTSDPTDILHIAGADGSGITIEAAVGTTRPMLTFINGDNTSNSVIAVQDDKAFTFEYSGLSLVTIDDNGRVGIGDDIPDYKLDVAGSVGATSFVNTSTAASKSNIQLLKTHKVTKEDREDEEQMSILEKIAETDIALYRYKTADPESSLRLGLIADMPEEYYTPEEVLALNDEGEPIGVDLYKLSTFTLAGLQELNLKVDTLMAASGMSIEGGSLADMLQNALEKLGVRIKNGVLRVKEIITDRIETKELCIGEGADKVCFSGEEAREIKEMIGDDSYPANNDETDKAEEAEDEESDSAGEENGGSEEAEKEEGNHTEEKAGEGVQQDEQKTTQDQSDSEPESVAPSDPEKDLQEEVPGEKSPDKVENSEKKSESEASRNTSLSEEETKEDITEEEKKPNKDQKQGQGE